MSLLVSTSTMQVLVGLINLQLSSPLPQWWVVIFSDGYHVAIQARLSPFIIQARLSYGAIQARTLMSLSKLDYHMTCRYPNSTLVFAIHTIWAWLHSFNAVHCTPWWALHRPEDQMTCLAHHHHHHHHRSQSCYYYHHNCRSRGMNHHQWIITTYLPWVTPIIWHEIM